MGAALLLREYRRARLVSRMQRGNVGLRGAGGSADKGATCILRQAQDEEGRADAILSVLVLSLSEGEIRAGNAESGNDAVAPEPFELQRDGFLGIPAFGPAMLARLGHR